MKLFLCLVGAAIFAAGIATVIVFWQDKTNL